MSSRSVCLACCIVLAGSALASAQSPRSRSRTASANAVRAQSTLPAHPRKVVKSDAEWARLLTQDQFLVTRKKETEQPFTGRLLHNKEKGYYLCVCCGNPLFTSRTKFDSGTGWPSFYAPIQPNNVANEVDNSYGQVRVEVVCSGCDAHLGHVFDDGPAPTGLRYCMNSLALKFVKELPVDEDAAKKAETTPAESDPAAAKDASGAKP